MPRTKMIKRAKKILSLILITVLSTAFVFGIMAIPGQNFAAGKASSALISLDKYDARVKKAKQTITGRFKDNRDIVKVSYELYSESDRGELSLEGEADIANDHFALEDIMLKPGNNTIAVTAWTAAGKKDAQTITVEYDSDSIKGVPLRNIAKAYPGDSGDGLEYAKDNLLVFFEENTSDARRQAVIDTVGGKCVGYINGVNMWQVEVKADTFENLNKTAQRLTDMDDVFFAGCNMVRAATTMLDPVIPNDPWYNNGSPAWDEWNPNGGNWSVEAIQALRAWNYQYFFNNIKVGIVDAGTQDDHEDLIGKVYFPDSKTAGENEPTNNHGTHVAGIMGAIPNNGKGVTGILWDTTMYVYNWDTLIGTDAHLLAGLTKTVQAGAKVVNFSLGLSDDISTKGAPSVNYLVIYYANLVKSYMAPLLENYDFIVVQSAGNGHSGYSQDAVFNGYFCSVTDTNMYGIDADMVQKINDRIIIVGSAQNDRNLNFMQASSSNAGSQVDICAPGVSIYGCYAGNSYNYMSGTSMAAPVTAGVIALAWSVNPALTGTQVRDIVLNNTSYMVKDNPSPYHPLVNTYPMVNAKLAVEAAIATLPVDYAAVNAAVATAQALDASLYTPASWAALTGALNSVIYNLESKYQVQINTMAQNINDAIAGLEFKMVPYTVEYRLNSESGEKIANDKAAMGQVTKNISETPAVIGGYEALVKIKTLTLGAHNNKIIFVYVAQPAFSLQIDTYKDINGALLPTSLAKPNDIITVTVTPTTNFYCAASRYIVLYDKDFYTMMGSGTSAFTADSDNPYAQNTVSGWTGTTTAPPPANWPATFTAGESDLYGFAAVGFNAGPSSANNGYPFVQDGERPLFSFRLKVKSDATGSGRIFMDNRWTRNLTFSGGSQYFYLCPSSDTPSANGTTAMNFDGDFSLADKLVTISSTVHTNFDLNGGIGTVPAPQAGDPGSVLTFPAQTAFEKQHYTFLGWATTPQASQALESYIIPANDATLYAVWSKTPIAIVPQGGSTTVIDDENRFIYGLETKITQSAFENTYIQLCGDARLEYTTLNGSFGTGTVVDIVDNDTQAILKSYRIVIFGDVNGDGNVDSMDAALMVDFENHLIEWDDVDDAAILKAAKLNGTGTIDSICAAIAVGEENLLLAIDQATGLS